MNENSSKNVGIGFVGALQIAFIILKLVKVINWSWWIVLLPLEIDVGIVVLAIIFLIIANIRN